MLNAQTLKGLQTQQDKVTAELKDLKSQQTALTQDINHKSNQLAQLRQKIHDLQKNQSELVVSEHAILRYLERVRKYDMKTASQSILTHELREIAKLGDGRYTVNGYTLIIKNNVVTTVI